MEEGTKGSGKFSTDGRLIIVKEAFVNLLGIRELDRGGRALSDLI